MNWLSIAILGSVVFALVSILDKVILVHYIRDARTFIVMVGFITFPMGLLILPFVPFDNYPITVLAAGYFSGFLWGISLIAMFIAMRHEDVSRVVPVISISPVFVAILAVMFLAEKLTALHWVAIMATVAGAIIISAKTTGSSRLPSLDSTFLLLIAGSLFIAGGQYLTKVAANDMSVWNLLTLRNMGLGSACILFMFRPYVLREMLRAMTNATSAGLFLLTEGLLVFIALVLTIWAIDQGPVSLVATAMSSRPLFVFIMSIALSLPMWKLLNESLDRRTLAIKLVSIAMIIIGISGISLL